MYPTSPIVPPSSPVRLADANSSCSGRVEIYHRNLWGTVCDDDFGLEEADVVCQQLGCGKAMSVHHNASFGEGNGPIWLDNVHCIGNESSLMSCEHDAFGTHDCDHEEDVSVICESKCVLCPSQIFPPLIPNLSSLTTSS